MYSNYSALLISNATTHPISTRSIIAVVLCAFIGIPYHTLNVRPNYFRYDDDQKIQNRGIPLAKSVANIGRLTLPAGFRFANVSKLEPVGALRVRAAGSTDDSHVKRRSIGLTVR